MQDQRSFRFRCGRLSLDFLATLGGRYRGEIERLADLDDLRRWFRLATGVTTDPAGRTEHLEQARALRAAIYRLVHPRTRADPEPADVALLNEWARHPGFVPELGWDARSASWHGGGGVDAGLATLARDAIDLLSGPWLERVRECAHPDCSLLFVDSSRPGRRRWCDMASCGNRIKARRYRSTHPAGTPA